MANNHRTLTAELREHTLNQAKTSFLDCANNKSLSKPLKRKLITIAACLLSKIYLQRGDVHHSITFVRHGARVMAHTWKALEDAHKKRESIQTNLAIDGNTAPSTVVNSDSPIESNGSAFWGLTHPLLRCILHLSSTYDYLGLFQETILYAKKAEVIAECSGSPIYKVQVAVWIARLLSKAGKFEEAIVFVDKAKDVLSKDSNLIVTTLACELSDVCRKIGDLDGEKQLLDLAEQRVSALESAVAGESNKPAEESATGQEAITMAPTRPQRATRKTPAASATNKKRSAIATKRAQAPVSPSVTVLSKPSAKGLAVPVQNWTQTSLIASVWLHRALSLLHRRDCVSASRILQQLKDLPRPASLLAREQVIAATCLINQSMEQMIRDPVFAVIPDSTISFPSIFDGQISSEAASSSLSPEKLTPCSNTPPRTTRSRGARAGGGGSPNFVDALKQAQEYLMESHSIAVKVGDAWSLHRIAVLLQNTSILLSATSSGIFRSLGCSGYATSSMELARNITWRRERKAATAESSPASGSDLDWPPTASMPPEGRRSTLGFMGEMSRFQKDFVDVIPKGWNVIAMSLSENRRDMCITKLRSGHSPLVLRIPLIKPDADGQVLDFERGREQFLSIIKRANETCHNGAKCVVSEWWAERKSLDQQLQQLLAQIESTWLCGFRGIFSQHPRRPDLLARFQKSLHNILDKHLPSRRSGRGGRRGKAAGSARVTLDPRILDLFIGLGDPMTDSVDFSDSLEDLLGFVVDVLQFHGERNPYDEIDYESMVVEAMDALRAYHSMCRNSASSPSYGLEAEEGAHSILVLDNALQCFPWESLPCMRGRSVSRVPSLACLRRLIGEQRRPGGRTQEDGARAGSGQEAAGHYVSAKSGAYILNPSSDLDKTLSSFEKPLRSLGDGWMGVVSRAPTEQEFEEALATRDLVLYFGHGSGSQYIRHKTVRRMDKCRAAVLLMGCSSASLPDVGEFERQGPVRNYMMAGCPAVVGTLWDVTDRDIDRLAGRIFEEWGLLPQHSGEKRSGVSLPQAVAVARDVCILKYLTAAAVCVYGVPVYINKDG